MVREGKTIENKVNFYNFTEVGQDRNTLVGGKTFDDSMIGKIEFMGNNEAAVFHEKGVTLFSNMKQPSVTAELTFPDQIQSMAYNEKYLAVVTGDAEAAQQFLNRVDAACVYVNASTRFTDGFEFGFGAEIGISTQKLHARGPMGLRELTGYKYRITGSGQVRE